jgi:hypothetical protein
VFSERVAKIETEAGDKIMSILLKRKKVSIALLIVVLGIAVFLVLPGLPFGKIIRITHASNRFISKQSITTNELDAARKAALSSLYAQLKAGGAFSEEEASLLKKFETGASITELEADTVISRALYDHFIAGKTLTKEQQELLDQYTLFVSRREKDILDLKTQKLKERKAAAQIPHTPQVAPSNDTCAGAEVIPAAGPFPHLTAVTADITDATTAGDPPLPSCQTDISRSIWYTFTPSTTATYDISSCASASTATTVDDTVMAIYTSTGGCAGPFTELPTAGLTTGCNDDGCVAEALQSVITTPLTAGTTYYILVWQFGTPPPTAGNTAVQLRVTQNLAPANNTCAAATPLTLNTPLSGTTAFAANDYQLSGAACFTGVGQTASTAAGVEVVYSFTAPSAGSYSFKVTNYSIANNLVLYAAISCPAATPGTPVTVGTCLAASNRNASGSSEEIACLSLSAGQQIFLFVDEDVLTTGSPFTIEATQCTAETEANNTPATANTFSCAVQGSINPAADVDFFSIGTPATGSRVFALLDGVSGNSTDFDMRVTTATDTLEYDDVNNDTAFGSLAPNIAGTPLTGVASFLRVNHNSAGAVAEPYHLYAVVQPPIASATAETEPNNTTGQANSAGNNYFSGSLSGAAPSADIDIFSFTATAGDLIMLNLDGDPTRNNTPINGALALLNSAGTMLVLVNDAGSTSSTTTGAGSLTATTPNSPAEGLVFRATTTGTYYARVSIGTSSTDSTGAGDYLLSIAKNCQVSVACTGITCPANITVNNDAGLCTAIVNYTTPSRPATGVSGKNMVLPNALNPGTEAVTVADATCTNPKTSFVLGETVCLKTSGAWLPAKGSPQDKIQLIDPNNFIRNNTNQVVTADPQNFTFTLPSTPTTDLGGGNIVNNIGSWAGRMARVSDSSGVSQPAPFTVSEPVIGPCGTVTCTPASGSAFPVGTTTVNCTSTGGPTCSFTVTVLDAQAPTVTCPANITTSNTPGQCVAAVTYTTPTGTDNCPGTVTVNCSPASGSNFAVGTTTVTCTANDTSPDSPSGTCTFTITVQDTQAPTVTCPANITVPNAPNTCSANVTYTTPTGTDNCPGTVTVNCSPASGSSFPVGTTTVTCTASDISPDSPNGTCTFTVTVTDSQPPTITCPANITTTSSQGQCGTNVTYPNPTITANCSAGNLTSLCLPPSGSFFPVGVTTVNCTIVNNASKAIARPSGGATCPTVVTQSTSQVITPGNSIACSNEFGHSDTSYWRAFNLSAFSINNGFAVQSVDIGIEQALSDIPPPKTKAASKFGRTSRPNTPTGTGQPLIVNLYFNTGGAFPNGTRNLISTANFTISDQSGTIVNLPINGTVPAGTEMVVEIFTPNGQIDGNLFFIGSNAAPETGPSYISAFDCGIVIPTPTAELNAPNMHIVMNVNGCPTPPGSSCSFTVTVQDVQPPTITCPENLVVPTDLNQCSAVVKFTPPPISDDCPCDADRGQSPGGASTCTVTCTPPSGSTFQKGTTTVTCIGTDASGNQSQPCSFTITVNDTQPPTITCPANQTVPTADGNPVTVNYQAPTVTDNCPLACLNRPAGKCTPGVTTCTPPSGSTFPVGTTTVNCEACDCAGNSASCSFTVTVVPCVITCPTNITQSNDPNQCGAVVTFAPTASAGCGTVTCSPASGSFFPVGITTVTCNTTSGPSCSFTVTINDTQPPSITCPTNVAALTARACPAPTTNVVNYPPPTASDNCPGVTVVCVPPSGSTFPLGTTTVTCTATDAAGNTATCSFTVTLFNACVQDDANPTRVLLWNTQTGDYRFCCNGSVFTGRGTVVTQGCIYTLNHIAADRRVSGKMDLSNFRGEGSLQAPPGKALCSISDRDIRNNTCQCQ